MKPDWRQLLKQQSYRIRWVMISRAVCLLWLPGIEGDHRSQTHNDSMMGRPGGPFRSPQGDTALGHPWPTISWWDRLWMPLVLCHGSTWNSNKNKCWDSCHAESFWMEATVLPPDYITSRWSCSMKGSGRCCNLRLLYVECELVHAHRMYRYLFTKYIKKHIEVCAYNTNMYCIVSMYTYVSTYSIYILSTYKGGARSKLVVSLHHGW